MDPVQSIADEQLPAGSASYAIALVAILVSGVVPHENTADATLSSGDTWTASCATASAASHMKAVNRATAAGMHACQPVSDWSHTKLPLTMPPTPPSPSPTSTTPTTASTSAALATSNTLVSQTAPATPAPPGFARLRGRSGCVKRAFTARVTGRSIAVVSFYVDSRLVKRINQARSTYGVRIVANRYSIGRHRIVARVGFLAESGTRAVRLPLTFRRCAQGAVTPRFTG